MPPFPLRGRGKSDLLATIRRLQESDVDWRSGRVFSQVYFVSDEHEAALLDAYASAFNLNGLSARAFPSLAQMERDVVEMAADLFGWPTAMGSLTSGGSESNLLALKAARDRMKKERPEISEPEIIVPMSAHPTIGKAAHYLGLRERRVVVTEGQEADPVAMAMAINTNTILLVGSAPSWPHGIVDPIDELGELALREGLLLHVDACVGGFVLPFARELGRRIRAFDFSVPGVSSISADLHKFGYAAKGASLILHREPASYESQVFDFAEWTGGRYQVATVGGTRPGGAIAASWFVLNYLGRSGYLELVDRCLKITDRLIDGIRSIPGLYIEGDPQMNLLAFGSRGVRIDSVAEAMRERGWLVGLQGRPPSSIHLSITPVHEVAAEQFLSDLRGVTEAVAAGKVKLEVSEAKYN